MVSGLTNKVEHLESEVMDLHNNTKVVETQVQHVKHLEERILQIENKLEYSELRDRKYNVLIYGVPTGEGRENTEEIVRDFFDKKLALGKEFAKNVLISNTHRLPRIDKNKSEGPPVIIVKMTSMKSRNDILAACQNIPRGSRMSIRTDLPYRLKEKRSQLAKVGYRLRQNNKDVRTRIRESIPKRDVWLETLNVSEVNPTWKEYRDSENRADP